VLIAAGVVGLLLLSLYSGLAWNNQPLGPKYGPGFAEACNLGAITRPSQTPSDRLSFDEAVARFQNYVTATGNKDLGLMEVMEFENNFYAVVYEKSTGIAAFELLIWKEAPSYGMMGNGMMGGRVAIGSVVPEPGPNMMWNTKYGMMQGMMGLRLQPDASSQMSLNEQDAKSVAEEYLSQYFPGAHVEGVTRFHGYYTLDFEKDGKIVGMLSVNGFAGQVWYHSWHDNFIREQESR
jgi:hypothetical protein